ncbi:hypothetical protein SAMN04488493_10732 [Xylanibacter ruminicola]|uniref:Ig-like domain-containing protein n=1 Tax=Xylanibacter ruminicola TaxID=839 RepID=UPI0008F138BE|nr:Ig-like domain-containing protein [Xylanibacter ruminicola]SFC43642.1 hypothetical protein SAMN04488493_10732 [Xylanibacter ruminicola]
MKFKEIMSLVLTVLGIEAFAKDNDGKVFLTDEQKTELTEKYGEKFVAGFVSDLAKYQEEASSAQPLTAEERLAFDASRKEVEKLKAQIEQMKKAEVDFQATIKKLEGEAANKGGVKVEVSAIEQAAIKAGVDLNLKHNRYLVDFMQGKVSAAYSGDSTIDTQELKKEFGKYVDSNRLEILKGLFGQTESTQFMSTIMTDKTEVRANQASIVGSVLQQFVPVWTPSGKAKFHPLTIKNFKCKINVPIIPSDIMEDILGYMYDEQASQLQSMPVVRYILYQLIFPKLDEEREQALAIGKYVENEADQHGEYTASTPLETMDGYLTQLVALFVADYDQEDVTKLTGVRWLQAGKQIDPSKKNVRTIIDAAVKEVSDKYPLYAKKKMKVHIDPVLADAYRREYLEEYKWLKNQDGTHKNDIDFSNFEFGECEGMRGTGCFFITPKENFKHLMSQNPQNTKLRFQEQDYMVKIFGEWWEGTGFWMAEAIFAYISPKYADVEPEADPEPEPEPTPSTKTDVTVAFASATASGTVGQEFESPVATITPSGKTLKYSSSNTAVATVNEDTGVVTLVAAGETVITAAFAGDDEYNAGSDSYTLTVTGEGI